MCLWVFAHGLTAKAIRSALSLPKVELYNGRMDIQRFITLKYIFIYTVYFKNLDLEYK